MIPKETINNILQRVEQVRQIIGTDTDKIKLELFLSSNPEASIPEFSEREIAIFRRVVQTGIISNAKYRRPNGFKIHGFLIYLRELQLRRYQEVLDVQRFETVEIMCGVWLKNIERANGDMGAEKEKMKAFWGETEMDSNTRSIFNQAYKLAKSQWETNTKNGKV